VTVSREGSSMLHVLVRGPPSGGIGSRISRPSHVSRLPPRDDSRSGNPRAATTDIPSGRCARAGPARRTHCRIDARASPGRERDGSGVTP
jgi:hypothetical protein